MISRKQAKAKEENLGASGTQPIASSPKLAWMKATYSFHTFAYRDPRSAFSSAVGLPLVSPTAVLLGIASTLFYLGRSEEAVTFLEDIHSCQVVVDPPDGAIFFRAFHQLRRYETDKYDKSNPRLGFTTINQGTREHALVQGSMTLFVGVPETHRETVKLALRNRDHLGTHDSLCSLVGDVEPCLEPEGVVYLPPEKWQTHVPEASAVTILTLSRFRGSPISPTVGHHWWMAGGEDTERVPYLIRGRFFGTTRGKIYIKDPHLP